MGQEEINVQEMFDRLEKFEGYDIICDYIHYGIEKREKMRLRSVDPYKSIFTDEGLYPFIGYGFAIERIFSIYGEKIYKNPYIDKNYYGSKYEIERIERLTFGDEYVDKRNKEREEYEKKLNLKKW